MYRNVSEWDLKVIIRDARKHPEIDEEFYAKQLMLQTHPNTIGIVLRTGHFAEWVKGGFVTAYDGHGYFVDKDGKDGPMVGFNPTTICAKAKNYPWVRWCNK